MGRRTRGPGPRLALPTSAALRARPGWEWLTSSRRRAGLLHPLGIFRRKVRDGESRRWAYILTAAQLADLRERYGTGDSLGGGLKVVTW